MERGASAQAQPPKPAEPKPAPAKTAPADTAKSPPAKAPEKAPEPEKAAEPAPEPAAEDENPAAKFNLAHDLRKAYNNQSRQLKALQAELTQLQDRSKSPETNEQASVLVEENRQLKKRLEDYDQEMRYMDYTRSQEFKDKFETPLQNALADAYDEVREFAVQNEDGTVRTATEADLNRILNAAPEQVRSLARDAFGDYAPDVLNIYRKIRDIRRGADREAKRFREEAKTRESQRVAKEVQDRETQEKLWQKANTEVVTKYPQYFGKVDGDDELNAALQKGYETVKLAHDPSLPIEERTERRAIMLHKAAGFSAMQVRLKRATDRIAELEGIVAEYEKSEPGEGKTPGTAGDGHPSNGAPSDYESVDDALGKMPRVAS